jgi:hypothetical protein
MEHILIGPYDQKKISGRMRCDPSASDPRARREPPDRWAVSNTKRHGLCAVSERKASATLYSPNTIAAPAPLISEPVRHTQAIPLSWRRIEPQWSRLKEPPDNAVKILWIDLEASASDSEPYHYAHLQSKPRDAPRALQCGAQEFVTIA